MHILVIRFSAMGDVALTAPVIHTLLERNPDLEITLVSNAFFEPLFNPSPRFHFFGADLKGKHKGVPGLRKLYKTLKANRFDAVVDLHDVIRSRIVSRFFRWSGHDIVRFDKGRNEKKQLLKPNATFIQLPHTTQRYLNAFEQLGLSISNDWVWRKIEPTNQLKNFLTNHGLQQKKKKWIGIAPFAKHESKMWAFERIIRLAQALETQGNQIFLFGGGATEIEKLKRLNEKLNHGILVAGNLDLSYEMELMQHLDLMVAMDSANMHLMSILGKPVVSIWGGTHYFAGFGPLNNEMGIVEVPKKELNCRPSTIYGKTNAQQLDCAKRAMDGITLEMVLEKVNRILR